MLLYLRACHWGHYKHEGERVHFGWKWTTMNKAKQKTIQWERKDKHNSSKASALLFPILFKPLYRFVTPNFRVEGNLRKDHILEIFFFLFLGLSMYYKMLYKSPLARFPSIHHQCGTWLFQKQANHIQFSCH